MNWAYSQSSVSENTELSLCIVYSLYVLDLFYIVYVPHLPAQNFDTVQL